MSQASGDYCRQNFGGRAELRVSRRAEASSTLRSLGMLLLAFSNPVVEFCTLGQSSNPAANRHNGRLGRRCFIAQQSHDRLQESCMLIAATEERAIEDAFEEAIRLCESKKESQEEPLSAAVPRLLRQVFDADAERVLSVEKTVQNVTCMQPAEDVKYKLSNYELLDLPLRPGRVCKGGDCCSACSRVTLQGLATQHECEQFIKELNETMDPTQHLQHFDLPGCAAQHSVRSTLTFLRFVERVRRAVAHEYGLNLSRIAPCNCQVYARGPGTFLGVHADESAFDFVHYSGVLYLGTDGEDFQGGGLAFIEKEHMANGNVSKEDFQGGGVPFIMKDHNAGGLCPGFTPQSGMAIMFSAGWENIHFVRPVVDGRRVAIPMFFSTNEPELPKINVLDDSVIAETIWRMVFESKTDEDFKQFQSQWHYWMASVGLAV